MSQHLCYIAALLSKISNLIFSFSNFSNLLFFSYSFCFIYFLMILILWVSLEMIMYSNRNTNYSTIYLIRFFPIPAASSIIMFCFNPYSFNSFNCLIESSKNSRIISLPINFRLFKTQAFAVVPIPMKGS